MAIASLALNVVPATSPSVAHQATLAPPSSSSALNGTVAVGPTIIGDVTNYPIGTSVPVSIKSINSSSFNVFRVSVITDVTILRPVSISSGDVFAFGTPFTAIDCVNGLGTGCATDVGDGPGVVTFEQTLLQGETANQTSATLVNINYVVTGKGATQIHILPPILSLTTGIIFGLPATILTVSRKDGLFANTNCGATLCKAPIVSFTIARNSTLVQDRDVSFNATGTTASNAGASIRYYLWNFGNGEHANVTANTIVYRYPGAGTFIVVLKVIDNKNATGFWSYSTKVSKFFIDLAIGPDDLTIDQTTYVLPGTLVNIGVTVTNLSTKVVKASVSIFLSQGIKGNLTLNHMNFTKLDIGAKNHTFAKWDTTPYAPKMYEIIGHVDPVRNGTMLIQNDTSSIDAVGFVQLVGPVPAGLSLSLVSSVSLGALLVVSVVVSLIRKVLSRKPELGPETP